MRVAFYAPLKPPDHPVPSGDRRVARLLIAALELAGHEVELAARLRSWDGVGDAARQARLHAVGERLAARLARRLGARPAARRPALWLTYHLYHKAPDWIGPTVSTALGIPYVAVEASVAARQAEGPWAAGHAAAVTALGRAAAVVALNPADEAGLRPHLAAPDRLHTLAPFLDPAPYAAAAAARADHRARLAADRRLPDDVPWLLAVGMMRPGDKLASYRQLAAALAGLADRPWRLLVAGEGPARPEVEAALAPLGDRVAWLGGVAEDALPGLYAAADVLAWPAVNEAFGMALLEAQAAGLPVVAGDWGGVGQLLAAGETGLLAPRGDVGAFAAALGALLDDPARRAAMSGAALRRVARAHGLDAAAERLDRILRRAAAA